MRRSVVLIATLAMVASIAPVATAEVQNRRINAWQLRAEAESYDPSTGTVGFAFAEAWQGRGEQAMLFVAGFTWTPLDCFEGAARAKSFFAEGPATLDIGRRYSSGLALATLDLVEEKSNDCTGDSSFDVRDDVQISLALTGEGPVLHERIYQSVNMPPDSHFHQNQLVTSRRGTGDLTVGSSVMDASGFIFSDRATLHARPPLEAFAMSARALAMLNEAGRLDYAEVNWASEEEGEYHDRFAGGYRTRTGETMIEVGGVDSIWDPIGECSVTTFMEGVGSGTVKAGPPYRRAHASGRVDLFVATLDECAGTEEYDVRQNVRVTLEAVGHTRVYTNRRDTFFLIPSVEGWQSHTTVRERGGHGSMTIGGDTYEPAGASIGREQVTYHERS
jgi:hypothetical protein